MSKLREQVLEFHRVFEHPIGADGPKIPKDDRVRFRMALIAEEFFEMLVSVYGPDELIDDAENSIRRVIASSIVHPHLADLVDAWADIDYVVEGARIEFGVDGDPIAAEVHRANMTKAHPCPACHGSGIKNEEREPGEEPIWCAECRNGWIVVKNADSKTVKPVGWTPPDIAGELARQQAPDVWPKADGQ